MRASSQVSKQVVACLIIARTVLNTSVRMIYPFLPALSRGMKVDLATISLAIMAASLGGMATPFLAPIAERWGRKTGMVAGMVIFGVGCLIFVVRPTFSVFGLSLLLVNVGNNFFTSASQAYLSDYTPYARRTSILALAETSWSLSFILGVPLMALLMVRLGWATPFSFQAVMSLLAGILVVAMIRSDRQHFTPSTPVLAPLKQVLRSASALAGLMVILGIVGANQVISLAFGVWMEDAFGLQIVALGLASALIGLSELGGEGLAAILSDRLGKKASVVAGLLVNSLLPIALPWLGQTLPGALAWLALFYLTFEFTAVGSISILTEILPGARATMLAAGVTAFTLGIALGALFAPALYAHGFQANSLACIAFNGIALLALTRLRTGGEPEAVRAEPS